MRRHLPYRRPVHRKNREGKEVFHMDIFPSHVKLRYSGRIDFTKEDAPEFIFPCSSVTMRFVGTGLKAVVMNRRQYWDSYIGVILDGRQNKYRLSEDASTGQLLVLGEGLEYKEHTVMLFKRQDACHTFRFLGFVIEGNADVLELPELSGRRLEFYGDSVSAGEVSEAVEYVGRDDPEHQGEYSNSWYSYAWMTARTLGAQIHDIAQGGAALMDGEGWFQEPDSIGMESIYDRLQYNPAFGVNKRWNFRLYRPHVVVVAIGQNDSHPKDYMKEAYEGGRAVAWREHYQRFVERLREIYPKAQIILTTTILQHDESWDRAIHEVCACLNDPDIHHFLYQRNGSGTPGHLRIPEAEEMSRELSRFIEAMGEAIWEDE